MVIIAGYATPPVRMCHSILMFPVTEVPGTQAHGHVTCHVTAELMATPLRHHNSHGVQYTVTVNLFTHLSTLLD